MPEHPPGTSAPPPPALPAAAVGPTTLGGVDLGSPQIRSGLLFSFIEGMLSNGMLALTETFSVAAAVSLGASPMAIALLGSLPLLIGYVGLFLAPALADPSRGRRIYVVLGVRAQALLLFVCAFAGWLPPSVAPWAFIVLFIAGAVSSHATGAFWVAWMGDLIPGAVRGRHWAWRNTWFSAASLSCSLTAGWLARGHDTHSAPWALFCCIFLSAAALRLAGSLALARQHEPPTAHPLEVFSPLTFRPGRAFVSFSLANAAFQGTGIMMAPFATLWYLRDLRLNYLWLSVLTAASVLGAIVFSRPWGHRVDKVGSAGTLRLAIPLSAAAPLVPVLVEHPLALCAGNFLAGAAWAGFGLAAFSRTLSLTESAQRHHYIACNSLIIGLAGSAMGLAGGFLATRLPPLQGYGLRSLFLLAAGLRVALWLGYFRSLGDATHPALAGLGRAAGRGEAAGVKSG